jgi:polysaccharide chain length determinant protein (PEP-CTERM system associated)
MAVAHSLEPSDFSPGASDMKIGLSTPQDFFALLIRRRWWVIGPFIALASAATVLTYFLPKSYVSETLIVVHPRDVPQDFVRDLISGSPQQRLRTIEQTILSRTNLIEILREFDDELPEFDHLNMDEKVVKLRGQINIDFTLEKSNGGELPLSYFRISYRNQNPELAQKIATKLTSLFIQQDNQARETQVVGTNEFLSTELAKVQDEMKVADEKLKEVKSSRLYELPDQRDANLRTLDRLGAEKKANAEALDRQLTLRQNLEREMSETPPTLSRPTPTAAVNPKVVEYLNAEAVYTELSDKYTAKHPEVQAAKAKLDRIKQRIPPELLAAATSTKSAGEASTAGAIEVPNPLYARLMDQMSELKTENEIRLREKAWIDSEIEKYTRRVEDTPRTEQDLVEVARQAEDSKKQYDDLKNKLSQARLSESLESKQKGAQFVVVDKANYPIEPDKPNKRMVLLGACVFSLLLAMAIAVGIDIARQKVWSRSQVEVLWNVPVLVEIPEILTDSDLAVSRRNASLYLAMALAGAMVYSVCLYGLYLKHNFILTQLDPLLQKIIYK